MSIDTISKPPRVAILADQIPDDPKQYPQWVLWRWVWKEEEERHEARSAVSMSLDDEGLAVGDAVERFAGTGAEVRHREHSEVDIHGLVMLLGARPCGRAAPNLVFVQPFREACDHEG